MCYFVHTIPEGSDFSSLTAGPLNLEWRSWWMGRSSSLISSQRTLATTPAFQRTASWRRLLPLHNSQWNVRGSFQTHATFHLIKADCRLFFFVVLITFPLPPFFNADPARVARMPRQTYLPAGMGGVIICPVQADPPVLYVNWTKDGNDLNLDNVSMAWRNKLGW